MFQKVLRKGLAFFLLLCALLSSVGHGAFAAYLPPSWHGVNHCMLMYHVPQRSVSDMKLYAAKMVDGEPREYLFDSYVFLKIIAQSGQQTDSGLTGKADWDDMLDSFFKTDAGRQSGDIALLDEALGEIAEVLGDAPAKRKVFIGVPWPNPEVTDFGDVDGDGQTENLSAAAGREKVLNWYIDEARSRWESDGYRNVELAGYYWIREKNDAYLETTAAATRKINGINAAQGSSLKFLWIPYYRAPGYETAYHYFHIVIMQPNYAFNTWMDGGNDRPVKLMNAAKECRDRTFGFEIENRDWPPDENEGAIFRRYLAYGAASREGYQSQTNAYFLDSLFMESTYGTPYEQYYHDLCDYVLGNPIADPDVRMETYTIQGNSLTGDTQTGAARLSYVDIVIDTASNKGWRGILTAELKTGNGGYEPVGWLVVNEDSEEQTDCYTIPVEGAGDSLRITQTTWVAYDGYNPGDASDSPFNWQAVDYLLLDRYGPRSQENYCLDKSYTMTPDLTERYYPDNGAGTKLIDGALHGTASNPFSNFIGWTAPVRIDIDLGSVQPVTGAEVYCLKGLEAGVAAPAKSQMTFAADKQPDFVTSGTGGFPLNFATVPQSLPATVSSYGSYATERLDYSIGFANPSPCRYISVYLEPTRLSAENPLWLMLSEIRVKNGAQVLPIQGYTLSVLSPAVRENLSDTRKYPDNGHKLTDGVITDRVDGGIFGYPSWSTGSLTFTVDLRAAKSIGEISLHALGGGKDGVNSPVNVAYYTSLDNASWTRLGTVGRADPNENLRQDIHGTAYTLRLASPVQGRYIRAAVQLEGWGMISEITARG